MDATGRDASSAAEAPTSLDEAEAIVRAAMPVDWSRQFWTHIDNDGERVWVDAKTSVIYPALPPLHPTDGHPV